MDEPALNETEGLRAVLMAIILQPLVRSSHVFNKDMIKEARHDADQIMKAAREKSR